MEKKTETKPAAKTPASYVKKYNVYKLEHEGEKLTRVKKIDEAILTPDQAKLLNLQKANTLREYVETKTK